MLENTLTGSGRRDQLSGTDRSRSVCFDGLNGSNEMTLASSNSLHQGLDPLPTQLFVAISERPPVQQITERNRIKQRIIRVEVALHLLPKMLGSQSY